jgi:hypothetical protein
MKRKCSNVVLAVALSVAAGSAGAQQAPPSSPAVEPALLTLPMGAQVRLRTTAAPGQWMKGILASADSSSVALVPEGAPPLGPNQLRMPSASVSRLELKTGSKRQWLWGLAIGAVAGLATGATADVDPIACEYDYNYECSRGAALALYGITMAGLGAGVGALVKTDLWTPVALDALAPPPARVSGIAPQIRAVRGGVSLGVAVGF